MSSCECTSSSSSSSSSSNCNCSDDCHFVSESSSSSSCNFCNKKLEFGEFVGKGSKITLYQDPDGEARIYKKLCPGSYQALTYPEFIPAQGPVYLYIKNIIADCNNNIFTSYVVQDAIFTSTSSTITFGNFSFNAGTNNYINYFVLTKYSPNLNTTALTKFITDDVDGYSAIISNLASDCDGNIYVAGYFNGTNLYIQSINEDNSPTNIFIMQGTGSPNAFCVKLNNNLEFINGFCINNCQFNGITIPKQKTIAINGSFSSSITLSPNKSLSGGGEFVALYDDKLNFEDVVQNLNNSTINPISLLSYCKEKIFYDIGTIQGTATFNSATYNGNNNCIKSTTLNSGTARNGYITKYNENLKLCKSTQIGSSTTANLTLNNAAIDEDGNLYLVGNFTGTMQFSSNSKEYNGNYLYLAKYNRDLKFCKATLMETVAGTIANGYSNLLGVSVRDGRVYVCGGFGVTLTFENGCTLTSNESQPGARGAGFIAGFDSKNLKLRFSNIYYISSLVLNYDGIGIIYGKAIYVDSSNFLYLSAVSYGYIAFGPLSLMNVFFDCLNYLFNGSTDSHIITYGSLVKCIGKEPRLKARLCCNGNQGKKIRNPFSNFEFAKVKVGKGENDKLIPGIDYFEQDEGNGKITIRASSDTCACSKCCKDVKCGKKECAKYVGTAVGTNCLLVCPNSS